MALVLVESPNKVADISAYLGKQYKVMATVGHFRDLDKGSMSIDMSTLEPIYQITKPDVVKRIRAAMKTHKVVYLATDMDREGEAISQHILDVFKPGTHHRLLFNEISKAALTKAVKNKTVVNTNLADSQKARRVIDRLYGYTISPLLKKQFEKPLSAGRVQSVTVRMLVDKEREIEQAIILPPENTFSTSAVFDNVSYGLFNTEGNEHSFSSEKEVKAFCKLCKAATFDVTDVQDSNRYQKPPPPYDTATLQRDASSKLKLTPKVTMAQAQELYEKGVITYIRTECNCLSEGANEMIERYVNDNYPGEYCKREYPADGPHEAIRPTNIDVVSYGDSALYEMIWKRTVASQMKRATIAVRKITIMIRDYDDHYFVGKLEAITDPGYLVLYDTEPDEIVYEPNDEVLLDVMTINQDLPHIPQRYSEASLISSLKKYKIGRPSTYANIMSTISDRGYVQKGNITGRKVNIVCFTLKKSKITRQIKPVNVGGEKAKMYPTELGTQVTDYLLQTCSDLLEYELSIKMEKKLDKVAKGQTSWHEVTQGYYEIIKKHASCPQDYRWKEGRSNVTAKIIIGKYGPFIAATKGKTKKNINIPKTDVNSLDLEAVKALVKF